MVVSLYQCPLRAYLCFITVSAFCERFTASLYYLKYAWYRRDEVWEEVWDGYLSLQGARVNLTLTSYMYTGIALAILLHHCIISILGR